VLGVREDGQKVLLAVKNMGGETKEAWRAVLDDLVKRGLRKPPKLLIVDGGAGLEAALAAIWGDVPTQRCTVHKHRNLLANAPERLHDEITSDYTDMIYADTPQEVQKRRKAFLRKWRLRHAAVANSLEEAGDRLFTFTHAAAKPMEKCTNHQRHRTTARRVQTAHQNSNRAAIRRHRSNAVLGAAGVRTDYHAKGRWLADTLTKAICSGSLT